MIWNNKSYIGLDYYHDANIWKGWEDMEPEEVNMSLNAFLNELVKMSIDDVKKFTNRIKLFRRE